MVEAMFERSPNYFKQFQKQFKFLILEEKPSFSIGNFYAVCAHFDSEFCNLVNSHYHVLIDTTTFENETVKRYQSFPVPCVYTAFKFLFWTAPNLETNGDVFTKLKLAIEFNGSGEKPIHSQCANDCQLLLTTTIYRKAALQNKQMSISNRVPRCQ